MLFKNKRRKRNFIIYHFLVESKPRERIDLLITASMNMKKKETRQKKKKSIPIVRPLLVWSLLFFT